MAGGGRATAACGSWSARVMRAAAWNAPPFGRIQDFSPNEAGSTCPATLSGALRAPSGDLAGRPALQPGSRGPGERIIRRGKPRAPRSAVPGHEEPGAAVGTTGEHAPGVPAAGPVQADGRPGGRVRDQPALPGAGRGDDGVVQRAASALAARGRQDGQLAELERRGAAGGQPGPGDAAGPAGDSVAEPGEGRPCPVNASASVNAGYIASASIWPYSCLAWAGVSFQGGPANAAAARTVSSPASARAASLASEPVMWMTVNRPASARADETVAVMSRPAAGGSRRRSAAQPRRDRGAVQAG